MILPVALALACASGAAAARAVSYAHLSLSSDPTRMHVQWTSAQGAVSGAPFVRWGASSGALTNSAAGASWDWKDPSTGRPYTFNQATMTGLTPGATVFYQVGSPDGVSETTSFNATRTDFSPEAPLRIAWSGDLGVDNAQALPFIQAEAAQGVYDHVVHVGDYACKYRDCRTPLPPARL